MGTVIKKEDAELFFNSILNLPSTWRETLATDPQKFLLLFMKYFKSRIPFQNLLMVCGPESWKVPDEGSILRQGLTGKGGSCHHLNYFAKLLLESVGFDVLTVQGNFLSAPVPNAHLMIIVKLGEDEMYLMEVGAASPMLDPVPLHRLPFRAATGRGASAEIVEMEDGKFGRFSVGGSAFRGPFADKEKTLRVVWDLVPRNLSDFESSATKLFTDPSISDMLQEPQLFRCLSQQELLQTFALLPDQGKYCSEEQIMDTSSNEDKNVPYVYVINNEIVIGDSTRLVYKRQFPNYKSMIEDVLVLFPMLLPKEEVMEAMGYFDSSKTKDC